MGTDPQSGIPGNLVLSAVNTSLPSPVNERTLARLLSGKEFDEAHLPHLLAVFTETEPQSLYQFLLAHGITIGAARTVYLRHVKPLVLFGEKVPFERLLRAFGEEGE